MKEEIYAQMQQGHAALLADRSQVHLARQDYDKAISDCNEALSQI